MQRAHFKTRSIALTLVLLVTVNSWAATPTITPELPDPGAPGFRSGEPICSAVGEEAGDGNPAAVFVALSISCHSTERNQCVCASRWPDFYKHWNHRCCWQ